MCGRGWGTWATSIPSIESDTASPTHLLVAAAARLRGLLHDAEQQVDGLAALVVERVLVGASAQKLLNRFVRPAGGAGARAVQRRESIGGADGGGVCSSGEQRREHVEGAVVRCKTQHSALLLLLLLRSCCSSSRCLPAPL